MREVDCDGPAPPDFVMMFAVTNATAQEFNNHERLRLELEVEESAFLFIFEHGERDGTGAARVLIDHLFGLERQPGTQEFTELTMGEVEEAGLAPEGGESLLEGNEGGAVETFKVVLSANHLQNHRHVNLPLVYRIV